MEQQVHISFPTGITPENVSISKDDKTATISYKYFDVSKLTFNCNPSAIVSFDKKQESACQMPTVNGIIPSWLNSYGIPILTTGSANENTSNGVCTTTSTECIGNSTSSTLPAVCGTTNTSTIVCTATTNTSIPCTATQEFTLAPNLESIAEERCLSYRENFVPINFNYYGLCYYVWFLLQYVHPKWATPELYHIFGSFLLKSCSESGNLFVYFVRKHAPLECLTTMTNLAISLGQDRLRNNVSTEFNPYDFLRFLRPGMEAEYLEKMEKLMAPAPLTTEITKDDLVNLFIQVEGSTRLEKLLSLVSTLRGKILIGENYVRTKNEYIHILELPHNWGFGTNHVKIMDLFKYLDCFRAPALPGVSKRLQIFQELIKSGHFSKDSEDKKYNSYLIVSTDYLRWISDIGLVDYTLSVSLDLLHIRSMIQENRHHFCY